MVAKQSRFSAMAPRCRWAITFKLDGHAQIWFTDSEEQARRFADNVAYMGAENSEMAA
jgi:hypothetical protein